MRPRAAMGLAASGRRAGRPVSARPERSACRCCRDRRPATSFPARRSSFTPTPPGGTPLLLDAFAQPDGKVHPAVVVVHGGGWTTGSRVAHIGQFLELLTEAGYQWVAIDYRLGGAAPLAEAVGALSSEALDAVSDVRAALEFIRCHARALPSIRPGS